MFYRFECENQGIYAAVEKDCPRDDPRRHQKPDGGWLPKVGKEFPGAISYFTLAGLMAYQNSGLSWWHGAVVNHPVTVLTAQTLENIVYEDEWQLIAAESNRQGVTPRSFDHTLIPNQTEPIDMVAVYVTRPGPAGSVAQCLIAKDPGNQMTVPADLLAPGEHPCEAAFRVVQEVTGFDCFFSFHKLRVLVLFNPTTNRFERYHFFQTGPEEDLPEQLQHNEMVSTWHPISQTQALISFSPWVGAVQFLL